MPMRYSRNASSVSSGNQLPVSRNAFSPAKTSVQAMLRPWPWWATAASITRRAAGQMSTPVPSPSIKGIIGSAGT